MSELISGKEAKLAWANGEKVQIRSHHWDNFDDLTPDFKLDVFDLNEFEFRLKPHTITLNGIDLPKPQSVAHCSQYPTAIEIDFYTEEQAIEFKTKFSNLW